MDNDRDEKSKFRADFRKKHDGRRRKKDFTREFHDDSQPLDDLESGERVSGKGAISRKRTVVGQRDTGQSGGFDVELDVDAGTTLRGRMLRVHGLNSWVRTPQGDFQCAVRGLLKSLQTNLQNVVVAGDYVTVQPVSPSQALILRVEPRRNFISRTSRGRKQIIASNIDLALIIGSLAEPSLKPNLIDRLLISVERAGIQPVIVLNKVDLVDLTEFQSVAGVWGQLSYPILYASAQTGQGIDRLRQLVRGRDSVVVGQSGVGKSSLLNSIQPGLNRRAESVSEENSKGRHTTTAAELLPLDEGGHIVDTPGIRQFQLWDIAGEEVEGLFRDLRCYAHLCHFPNCTHTHEAGCRVKQAVADGHLALRRYDSFCQIRDGD